MIHSRKSQYQIWYETVKRELLLTEPQNILARTECCQNIINECMTHINNSLGLTPLSSSQMYICNVTPTNHLKYLLNWPGLRVDNSPKAPKSKKEYEKKSKNWLNGRRAPNYGKTLFPFFINDAERYLKKVSKILIKNDQSKQKLYYDIVIYKILAQLCGCSVSLHEQAKKAPFFCKNSVERKGRLKEILQQYAKDHQYIQGFPSCFEEAIGFFDTKSNHYFHQYRTKYMGYTYDDSDDDDDGNNDHGMDIKSSNKSDKKTSKITKKEPKNNSDAQYWKSQALKLQQQIEVEKKLRIKAEAERDTLRSLINGNTKFGVNNHNHNHRYRHRDNNNNHCNHSHCCTPDDQYTSCSFTNNDLGSSTASTSSSIPCQNGINNINNMPALQSTSSYGHSAHSSVHSVNSHHSVQQNININNGNSNNNSNSNSNNNNHHHHNHRHRHRRNHSHSHSSTHRHLPPPIIGYVPNTSGMQINHNHLNRTYVPIVNTNNNNLYIHSDPSVPDIYTYDNNNMFASYGVPPIQSSVIPTSSQPQQSSITNNNPTINSTLLNPNNNQTINPSSDNNTFDAFSKILEMPVINRRQHNSNDSFGLLSIDMQNNLNSPAPIIPMYSFQNAVVTTNANCV